MLNEDRRLRIEDTGGSRMLESGGSKPGLNVIGNNVF
jgi:hypothetical protein